MVTMGRHGLCRLILHKLFFCFIHYPQRTGMRDRSKQDGLSMVFAPLYFNFSEFGFWDYSLIIMTNQQNGPSWLRRSSWTFVHPTLGQTSPSSFSSFSPHYDVTYGLSQARQTVINSLGRLFCISH